MQEKLEQRLEELKDNYQQGVVRVNEREALRVRLAELDSQAPALVVTMNRISGAIQVIEETLGLNEVEDGT